MKLDDQQWTYILAYVGRYTLATAIVLAVAILLGADYG